MNKYAARMTLDDFDILNVSLDDSGKDLIFKINNLNHKGELHLTLGDDSIYAVGYSLATKGLGPLMYDIAMEYITKKGSWMACDRWSPVSPAAMKVWDTYLHQRSDVRKRVLTDFNSPESLEKSIRLIGYYSIYTLLEGSSEGRAWHERYPTLTSCLAGGMIRYHGALSVELHNLYLSQEDVHFISTLVKNSGTNYAFQKPPDILTVIEESGELTYV